MAAINWTELTTRALRALSLQAEAEELGVVFSTGKPNAAGWLECHAIDRDDATPSAAVNVGGEDKLVGRYTDLGGSGKSMSFFELAAHLGRFRDWKEARDYYFIKAGIELPKASVNGHAKAHSSTPDSAVDDRKVIWLDWYPPAAAAWCERYKRGIHPKTLEAAGARMCLWPAKSPNPFHCIAIPSYLSSSEPAGWAMYRSDGQDFSEIKGDKRTIKRRKVHNLGGTVDSWIHGRGREDLITADIIWKVEGPSDALALGGILPAGHAVVANTSGAGSQLAGVPFDIFKSKIVYVVGDADKAGVEGSAKHARLIAGEGTSRVYLLKLPFEVVPDHGQDLRDWINAGHNGEDIQDLTSTAELVKVGESVMMARSNMTDLANAERMVARHGKVLRYCHPWSKWLVWDGRRWKVDDTAEIGRRAKETAKSIYAEAARIEDSRERQGLAAWAKQSESKSRLADMISLANSEPGIPIVPDSIDRDPWLLNVANGTLDLRNAELRPHRQEDFCTKLADVDYDPDAECTTWLAFLDRIFSGNQHLIDFLQRAAGYSLTGITSERCLLILHGKGANGKSTFLETLADILGLGEYALRTPTETLMVKPGQGGGIPNDVARLKGARFVWASESEEGQRLAEASIKDLTGGDTISARFMRAEWFDFKPEFKLWLGTNHKPVIRGTDNAIWDRIRLIPFDVRIPEEERDKQLRAKLSEEDSGILAWAVRGCLEWQAKGLGEPEESAAAKSEYRTEMDIIGEWIDDCCFIEQYAKTSAADLYKSYSHWCEENGIIRVSQKRLAQKLYERELSREQEQSGPNRKKYVWYGIGLSDIRFRERTDRDNENDPESDTF